MSKIWIATGTVLFPGIAVAHLDHVAGDDFGLVHYLSDPVHIALAGTAVLLFATVRWFARGNHAVDRGNQ